MVEKNIVEIPRNGTENVEFELNIPLTVTSGEYTLRVLQIPTDPETLGPILDIPDMDNEKDPSTYTALKAILKQLKAQNQRVITEYFKDFKFENKQIDTHVKETGELLTFFDKRFVQAAEKHPDELIKATVKNPKSMKLNELPTLWEDANQMYRSLSPNAEWQKKRRTAEMAYKVVEEPEERVQAVIKRAGVRVEQHNAQSKDKLIFWADRGHKKINEGILDNPVAIQIFKEEFNEGFFHYMQTVLNFCKEVFIAFKGRSTKPVGQDRFQAKQATQGNPNLDQLRNAG